MPSDTLPAFVRRARKRDGREKQGGRGESKGAAGGEGEDDGFCLGTLELIQLDGVGNGKT